MPTHVAAPSSTNCERVTAAPPRERFVRMCACTDSAGTGFGAVSVEHGGQTCPNKMWNHDDNTPIHTLTSRKTQNKAPYPPRMRAVVKRLFSLGKTRKKGSRFALVRLSKNQKIAGISRPPPYCNSLLCVFAPVCVMMCPVHTSPDNSQTTTTTTTTITTPTTNVITRQSNALRTRTQPINSSGIPVRIYECLYKYELQQYYE